ncbi:MAG: hypothetical protein AAGA92_16085, partial [Planctomycetota bacterium]
MLAQGPIRVSEIAPDDLVSERVLSMRGEVLFEAGEVVGHDGVERLTREGVSRLLVRRPSESVAEAAADDALAACVLCGNGL